MFMLPPGKWEGLDGMGDKALRAEMKAAERTVLQVVVYAASEVKKTLSGMRTGRTYRVGKNRLHIAAAPGEPPAVLFGNLRNSVGWSKPVWDGATVSAEFGVGLGTKPKGGVQDPGESYGRIQEFGGIAGNGARIPAHPYMEPTAVRISPKIEDMLERGFTEPPGQEFPFGGGAVP